MIKPDKSLAPDWDEDNINHIAEHGLSPEQVEELYYSEGPFPTLAVKGSTKNDFTFLHPVFTSSSSDLKPQ
jgi:hypothetical protein